MLLQISLKCKQMCLLEFITNLMHSFIYSIIMLHHDPQHVSSIAVLIFRRTIVYLHYLVSSHSVCCHKVHRSRADSVEYCKLDQFRQETILDKVLMYPEKKRLRRRNKLATYWLHKYYNNQWQCTAFSCYKVRTVDCSWRPGFARDLRSSQVYVLEILCLWRT
jgi:tryptophan-rich sensory protein